MNDFFGLIEHRIDKLTQELTEALLPSHEVLTAVISEQTDNLVVDLPADLIVDAVAAAFLQPYCDAMLKLRVWSVKLAISPSGDQEGEKTWIKKTHIWSRMLEAACVFRTSGQRGEIGYKEAHAPSRSLFRPASKLGLPYGPRSLSNEVLLCGIGPLAESALKEAVGTEHQFNPREWDTDGYYIGPAQSTGKRSTR